MKSLPYFLVGIGVLVYLVIGGINASYDYGKNYSVNWELSDKASTIAQKSEYIDKFVDSLDKSGLQGTNSAMFYQTENTSFDSNMVALKSLQARLNAIKTMDENSFAYQTAIQQITEQEQGQAQDMLDIFRGCYMKIHHYFFWNEFLIIGTLLIGILSVGFGVAIVSEL